MTFPIPVSCRVNSPLSSLVFLLSMRCGIDPASPSSFYILLDDKACLSMFYPAFAPLSTTGMVILPAPLSYPAARARSPSPNSHFIVDDGSLRCQQPRLTLFRASFNFLTFQLKERLYLYLERGSGTTLFRARRLTSLCIPTKVSQTCISLMHPAASLI